MKLINKTLFIFLLVISVLCTAQTPPDPPGGGTGGPGAAASPVDMYVYVLGVVAILFIIYFAKQREKKHV